ncbi:MAG: 3-hydroxyacyl-CoA dehydrogenase NAD-binding domain-containing protein [Flavitalea sp.]
MFQTIAVIGAGTMGNGIAHVLAQSGFAVHLTDINAGHLDKSLQTIARNMDRQVFKGMLTEEQKKKMMASITAFTDMQESVKTAGLVIEAATENETIKLNIFRQLDQWAPAGCILASNTSSISITKIAAATARPGQVIGMHFMNPVPVMQLVEIINGFSTDKEITKSIVGLTEQLGKIPCVVNDYPGFIANRILMPMINEAIYSLHEGVAGVKEIDTIMKLGMAHPMGPLQLADFIGLDTCQAILQVMYQGLGKTHYVPCPLLSSMVAAGCLGVKSGEGFYDYTAGTKNPVVSRRFTSSI